MVLVKVWNRGGFTGSGWRVWSLAWVTHSTGSYHPFPRWNTNTFQAAQIFVEMKMAGCRYQNLHQRQNSVKRVIWSYLQQVGAFFSFNVWHEQWRLATCLLGFAWSGVRALRKEVMNEHMKVSQESYGLGSSDNLTSLNYSWSVYYLHYCLLICWHKVSGCSLLPKATDDMQLWNCPFGNMRPMTSIRTKSSDTPLRESDYG